MGHPEGTAHVIASTHGKRAIDNLSEFKPHLKPHEMNAAVNDFEESILFFADAYNKHGPGSRRNSVADTEAPNMSDLRSLAGLTFAAESENSTPGLTPGSSAPQSRAGSFANSQARRPSFATSLSSSLSAAALDSDKFSRGPFVDPDDDVMLVDVDLDAPVESDSFVGMDQRWADEGLTMQKGATITLEQDENPHFLEPWQLDASLTDRSVQILPGVARLISSIPEGRYAVATSGAKTYAHGCLTRVGIVPPPVTITACDPRLRRGKPHPDPFILAANCLGFKPERCVVFEDSPSGIKAGVASGAVVIAVCTSHNREDVEGLGAAFVVRDLECVRCEYVEGQLKFSVDVEAVEA